MPSTHAIRNRRSQTKAGGAPHLRSAAQVFSPVLAPVRRFVPIPRSRWHPYPSNSVSAPLRAAVRNCELRQPFYLLCFLK